MPGFIQITLSHIIFFARDLLIKPYIFPPSVKYLLSILLSIPYWIFCKIFNLYSYF